MLTVKISRYARGGFAVLLAAEEALATDMWGPKDEKGNRPGHGERKYVSQHTMNGAPCPTIYTYQSLPYIAALPRDPWAKNQPTREEVADRIAQATGFIFEFES